MSKIFGFIIGGIFGFGILYFLMKSGTDLNFLSGFITCKPINNWGWGSSITDCALYSKLIFIIGCALIGTIVSKK